MHPPKLLFIRGRAALDVVEGIPEEYLQINGIYTMTAEQRAEWEAEIRSPCDGMVRIVVTPAWAKLIDFETTLPLSNHDLPGTRDGEPAVAACRIGPERPKLDAFSSGRQCAGSQGHQWPRRPREKEREPS